ncbi:clamp loader subunit [Agrobacterium phage OLIVR5]|uniref:Clamp loader subunit n=1 Tax=Agrobacterium phage OLIVR5 TaxID=2723773 RepID=A0A858MYM6_9CAUD|nr:clamp loader subunit [Agrobacterium phage OLIVR5]QIW87655.1 clamp loader subunit [Agrobacterium phage OLIVR5]QIW87914.1 clamp loader subunit [Agrobacterium phage OLIVR6]
MAKASPFDFINAVYEQTGNAVIDGKLDAADLNRFMFLRGLGFSEDSVLFADFVQTRGNIPNNYLFTIMHELVQPKTRRRTKWVKGKAEFEADKIEYVCDALKCSQPDALEILRSLDETELSGLLAHMEKAKKEKRQRKE